MKRLTAGCQESKYAYQAGHLLHITKLITQEKFKENKKNYNK
jgi:hypothetical protein